MQHRQPPARLLPLESPPKRIGPRLTEHRLELLGPRSGKFGPPLLRLCLLGLSQDVALGRRQLRLQGLQLGGGRLSGTFHLIASLSVCIVCVLNKHKKQNTHKMTC